MTRSLCCACANGKDPVHPKTFTFSSSNTDLNPFTPAPSTGRLSSLRARHFGAQPDLIFNIQGSWQPLRPAVSPGWAAQMSSLHWCLEQIQTILIHYHVCSWVGDFFCHIFFINPVFWPTIKSTSCICAALQLWQPALFLCFCPRSSTFLGLFQRRSGAPIPECATSLFLTEAGESCMEKAPAISRTGNSCSNCRI